MSKSKPKHNGTDLTVPEAKHSDHEVIEARAGAARILALGNDLLTEFENSVEGGTTRKVVQTLWSESQNIGNEPKDRIKALEVLAKLTQTINDIRMRSVVQYTQTLQVIAAATIHKSEDNHVAANNEINNLLASVNGPTVPPT